MLLPYLSLVLAPLMLGRGFMFRSIFTRPGLSLLCSENPCDQTINP
jgi:hypothetical protein